MMPHPTMLFAWDEAVLRYAGRIISILGLALTVLFGSAHLASGAQDVSPAAAAEPEDNLASPSAAGAPP